MRPGSWLSPPRPPEGRLRLFCFPHAGAGASVFRQWSAELPPAVEVWPVQLPGREARFRETPYDRIDPLVTDLMAAIGPELKPPFALFGHSLGALVAFELTRALRSAGLPMPVHLVVSGRIAPQLADPRRKLHDMPLADFVQTLRALAGTPPELLRNESLLAALMPLLRADFAVNETYDHRPEPPLDVPLTVIGGTADSKTERFEIDAWRQQTKNRFRSVFLPGGHFFVVERRELVLRQLREDLAPWLG